MSSKLNMNESGSRSMAKGKIQFRLAETFLNDLKAEAARNNETLTAVVERCLRRGYSLKNEEESLGNELWQIRDEIKQIKNRLDELIEVQVTENAKEEDVSN